MLPEENLSFSCPYCGTEMTIQLEPSAGQRQLLTTDCEICCRPIEVRARFDESGICEFSAEAEN